MPKAQEVILRKLKTVNGLLTEHELATAVAEHRRESVADVQTGIGLMLIQLKNDGLVWAGELTNHAGQVMWAACLTEKGKLQARYG